jgi:hypothetical protein
MLFPQTCDSGAQLSGAPCQPNQQVLRFSQQGGQPVPRMRHILLNLGVVLTIAGALTLSGCAATDGQATEEDVNNNAFTFPSGTVFHPALTTATTLEFTDNANTFTLSSAALSSAGEKPPTASGSNRFGSCILTVSNSSYAPGTGPQLSDVITLSPCNFDSTNRTLTVSNGSITATSNPAIARLVNATAGDLNDKTFLFASGEIFHPALVNIPVTLKFTNNGNDFTLTSTENTNNEATGHNAFGSCTLTVGRSTYRPGTGPQVNDVITLSTCQFNSSTGTLTISNGTIGITSI